MDFTDVPMLKTWDTINIGASQLKPTNFVAVQIQSLIVVYYSALSPVMGEEAGYTVTMELREILKEKNLNGIETLSMHGNTHSRYGNE